MTPNSDPLCVSFFLSSGCPNVNFNELVTASTDGTYLPTSDDVNFRCGVARLQKEKSTFIIGGEPTKLQEFPFAVLLVNMINKIYFERDLDS